MTSAAPSPDRLVTEALAKSGLLWITSPSGSAPCWHAHLQGVAYVVSGDGEQFSPDHEGRVSIVTRSKESRARLASFDADAHVMSPEDEDWEAAVFALKAGRLNAPAGGDIETRWRDSGRITRYTPDLSTLVVRGRLVDAPATPSASASQTPTSGPSPSTDRALGTQAPTDERPAAAAAEREYREALRAEEAPPATDLPES